MGRKIVWDGEGLPEIGDEVLFFVGSDGGNIPHKGTVKRVDVSRYDRKKFHSWSIFVHMDVFEVASSYEMARHLEDIRPLLWQVGDA